MTEPEISIGSSAIASILGINPHKSREQLFGEMRGLIPIKDLSEKPDIQRGKALEHTALGKYEDVTGRNVYPPPKEHINTETLAFCADHLSGLYAINRPVKVRTHPDGHQDLIIIHPDYPYFHAQIDGYVMAEQRIVEAKCPRSPTFNALRRGGRSRKMSVIPGGEDTRPGVMIYARSALTRCSSR